jgi:hypothetical protein
MHGTKDSWWLDDFFNGMIWIDKQILFKPPTAPEVWLFNQWNIGGAPDLTEFLHFATGIPDEFLPKSTKDIWDHLLSNFDRNPEIWFGH